MSEGDVYDTLTAKAEFVRSSVRPVHARRHMRARPSSPPPPPPRVGVAYATLGPSARWVPSAPT